MEKKNRHLELGMVLELMVFMMPNDREASSIMTRTESGMRQRAWVQFTVFHGIGRHAMNIRVHVQTSACHGIACAQLMSAVKAVSLRFGHVDGMGDVMGMLRGWLGWRIHGRVPRSLTARARQPRDLGSRLPSCIRSASTTLCSSARSYRMSIEIEPSGRSTRSIGAGRPWQRSSRREARACTCMTLHMRW